MATRIKICCIASVAEAELAIAQGADALGLVSAMPNGPGVIGEATIASIAEAVPPGVARFLLTSKVNIDAIVDQQRRLGADVLQIVDRLAPGDHARLRRALPAGIRLVQVIHVTGPDSVEEARQAGESCDAILLDSGNQMLAVKALGGTGRVHDWTISRRIRDALRVPIFLAGGLRPDNVTVAIGAVAPFGVDVCSGVRTDGRLDPEKLAAFAAAVRST